MTESPDNNEWKKIEALFLRPAKALPSEAFVQGVMRKIEGLENPRALRWGSFPRWALVGAAAAAVALMVVFPFVQSKRMQQPGDDSLRYVSEFIGIQDSTAEADNASLNTAVEAYFL